MTSPLKLEAKPDLNARIAAIEHEGFAYFPGILDAGEVASLREAIDRLTAVEASFDRDSVSAEGLSGRTTRYEIA